MAGSKYVTDPHPTTGVRRVYPTPTLNRVSDIQQVKRTVIHTRLDPFYGKTFQEILGDNLVELWDSRLGIASFNGGEMSKWTGQIAGTELDIPEFSESGPVYGPDEDHFNGHPVVQLDGQNALYLSASGFDPFWLAGSNPYLAVVGRIPTVVLGSRVIQFYEVGFANPGPGILLDSESSSEVGFYESITEESTGLDIDEVVLGVSEDPSSDPTNYGMILCCREAPSPEVREGIRNVAKRIWGF